MGQDQTYPNTRLLKVKRVRSLQVGHILEVLGVDRARQDAKFQRKPFPCFPKTPQKSILNHDTFSAIP